MICPPYIGIWDNCDWTRVFIDPISVLGIKDARDMVALVVLFLFANLIGWLVSSIVQS